MPKTLRLLIIEDSIDDTLLLVQMLQRAKYDVQYEQVQTAEELRAALGKQPWDVITSDHAMPRFSAPEALAIAKEFTPDTPFLILSGEMDLGLSVSLMKSGAQDYITKREFERVVPAIERELREVAVHRARQSADTQIQFQAGLINHVNDAVIAVDMQRNILSWNAAAEKIYGWKAEDVVGKRGDQFIAGERTGGESIEEMLRRLEERGSWEGEVIQTRRDGTKIPVFASVSLIRDPAGQSISMVAINRDIRRQKQTESDQKELEEKFHSFLEEATEGFAIVDENGLFIEWNRATAEISGIPREEAIGKPYWELQARIAQVEHRSPEAVERMISATKEALRTGSTPALNHSMEGTLYRPNGEIRHYQQIAFPIKTERGYCIGLITRDVTGEKRAQAAIAETERIFRNVIEHAMEGMAVCDETGNIVTWNKSAEEITGLPAGETVGKPAWEIQYRMQPASERTPEHRQRLQSLFNELFQGKFPERKGPRYSQEIERPDGSRVSVETENTVVPTERGFLVVGTIRDLTAQRRAESQLSALHDLTIALNAAKDLSTGLRLCLETAQRVTNMDCGGIYLLDESDGSLNVAYHRGLSEAFLAEVRHLDRSTPNTQLVMAREAVYSEYLHLGLPLNDIERIEGLRAIAILPIAYENQIIGCMNIASHSQETFPQEVRAMVETMIAQIGITLARLKAVDSLKESNERLSQLTTSLREAVWLRDVRTLEILYINPAYEAIWGRPCQTMYEDPRSFLEAVHPEDKERIRIAFERQVQGEFFDEEYRIIQPDGAVRWIWGRTFPVRNQTGEIYRLTALAEDITDRKRIAEEMLLQNQELEQIGDLIASIAAKLDLSSILQEILKKTLEITGLEGGTLCFFDMERKCLQLVADQNASAAMIESLRTRQVQVGDCLCGRVVETGEPLILWDNASGSEYATREAIRAEGIRFHAAFPLRIKDRSIGVLCLFARSDLKPSIRKIELIKKLCPPIALAIDNARLYEETRENASELERRVRERTAQLEATNKELDSFAHSVSHDLRAPLRAIEGFSEVLEERSAQFLDEESRTDLRRIRSNVHRMKDIIDSLLELSRVGLQELHREPVNLTDLAESVVEELRQRDPDRSILITVADGLSADADYRLLRVALGNLLGNAWKFTAKTEQARIEFRATSSSDGETVFSIRDNGAGFEMTLREKLFIPFQRLHTEADFPGTGIGLATVQRIIHRHGGKIWAEGAPNQGATFFFTLPELS